MFDKWKLITSGVLCGVLAVVAAATDQADYSIFLTVGILLVLLGLAVKEAE